MVTLRKYILNHLHFFHSCELKVKALMAHGQFIVIDSHKVQNSRIEVID